MKPSATPYPAPLHAHKRKPDPRPTEVTRRDAALVVGTLIMLALILGALFGASMREIRDGKDLARCEEQFGRACILAAIPRAQP